MKLSKTQRDILINMANGWKLRRPDLRSSYRIQKDYYWKRVLWRTLRVLKYLDLIAFDLSISEWAITEKGKEALR